MSVVHIEYEEEIAIITMDDREHKNTFSRALIEGIMHSFEEVGSREEVKVVILQGSETIFSAGGTLDELLEIAQGKAQFSDLAFFDLPLKCPVPVISAMQGHALGGGLVFGLYSDIIVMGEECVYSTNFMKYGFTPGMGGTLIVPWRLGDTLGNEMLMTAKTYRGKELKERGAGVKIVPKAQVQQEALTFATELAKKPRISLTMLKEHLRKPLMDQLTGTIEKELKMHDVTFSQPGIQERIKSLFGQ